MRPKLSDALGLPKDYITFFGSGTAEDAIRRNILLCKGKVLEYLDENGRLPE